MTTLLSSVSRYVLDTRQHAYPGLPRNYNGSDPYLQELLALYPIDLYPGGLDFDLPEGPVRAWRFGGKDSKKGRVLLVHGLSMPSIIWQPVANALAEAGYEIALFDLYGRGYSSAPRGEYKNSLYVNQILGVLDKLGWAKPIYLAGLSMGGPICSEFTALFPERVKKVALLAPAAFFDIWPSPTSKFGLGMLLVPWLSLASNWPLRRAYARYSTQLGGRTPAPQSSERLQRIVALEYCTLQGFASAVAKSALHGPLFDYKKPYYALAKAVDIDVLVIWGTADAVVPYGLSKKLMPALGSRATLHTVQGGVHDLPTSNYRECNKALLEFFH